MDKVGAWRVGVLICEGTWGSSIAVALDLFQSVNMRRQMQVFNCEVITPDPDPVTVFSGYKLGGDVHVGATGQYDLIVLSHFWGDLDQLTDRYQEIGPWLQRQYEGGATIAGINSGIYWAAEAGLLDGLRATTYWRFIKEVTLRYPKVNWLDNQALVEDGGIYSSNGQNASVDMTMYLVEKFCGADMAAALARDTTFDFRRNYDLTLFNIAGLRQHRDPGVHKAQDWLDENYQHKVQFHELADRVGMSKRTFIRRFKKSTGEKPTRYLQRLRIEAAKHQLINSGDSIKTIGLSVGYRDFGYFSEVFKSITELNPRQFRARFRPG